VILLNHIADVVIAEAERNAATENEVRVAVRAGMPPLQAYKRFGTF
jgi:hypothetical protein